MSVGDPDKAQNVAVVTPGMNSNVTDSMSAMVGEARDMRRLSDRIDPGEGEPAVVSWIGYEPPNFAGDDLVHALANASEVMTPDRAIAGGRDLAAFVDGIDVSHDDIHGNARDYNLTMLGYSYGSSTTGAATQYLAQDGNTPVDNVILYGSPGVPDVSGDGHSTDEKYRAPHSEIGVEAGQRYYMQADRDQVTSTLGELSPSSPERLHNLTLRQSLGSTPADWGMEELETDVRTVEGKSYSGATGHSEYTRMDGDKYRTTMYNMVAVMVGQPEMAVRAE